MRPDCPLCGAPAQPPFLHRANVPLHQNLIVRSPAAARTVPRGDLAMAACQACGFVFNRAFDPARLRYGPDYDSAQAHSPRFAAHLDGLARELVEERGVRGARIVEVGCGQGDLLRRLVAWPGAGNRGIGFDPAYAGSSTALDGRLRFERAFYGPDCAGERADVVVCRHVIEHVAEPLGLLAAVRAALDGAAGARVFFETPCIAWTLRNRVVWDFAYEHCSLFTARSLACAFARAGFAVSSVRHVFAGQYLWLEATPGHAALPAGPGRVPHLARQFGAAEPALLATWRARLAALREAGPVALWCAAGKGVTFAALADPDATTIDCLADINPGKQGCFVPGTAHPILPPAALPVRGVRNVVLMNPVYRAEVAAQLGCLGARLADWAV
jgi:SAM-dependent methyltransferase